MLVYQEVVTYRQQWLGCEEVGGDSDGVRAIVLNVKGLQKQKGRKKEKKEAKEGKSDRKETKQNRKELKTKDKAQTAAEWGAKSQRAKAKQLGKRNRKG